ncbi:MAG: hypothetical protein ABW003_00700 [Microvirga sp.]
MTSTGDAKLIDADMDEKAVNSPEFGIRNSSAVSASSPGKTAQRSILQLLR